MAACFFDTSALVKRQVPEPGHPWIRRLCRPSTHHSIVISEAVLVEVVANICRCRDLGSGSRQV